MGTSSGYNAPTSPQWTVVKSDVTRSAPGGRPSAGVARRILREYVEAAGGPRRIATGGGSVGGGAAAQRVAASLASFAQAAAANGLDSALRGIGLGALVGRPLAEVLDALVDRLGGPASSLDDVDARNALSRLRDEMFDQCETTGELEETLTAAITGDGLAELLMRFYSFCLFEQFTRTFYERLVARVGDLAAGSFLGGIKDYIASAIEAVHVDRDLRRVDWAGAEGRAIADGILQDCLFVFAGE